MPNYDVRGRDAIFDLKVGDDWFPIFCATVNTFDLEQDEVETTHINSGPNREYAPGMSNATMSVTGITRIVNDDGRINITYLMQQSIRRQTHELRLRMTDQVTPSANTSVINFNAFIKNTNITNDKSVNSNSSITFRVTGGLTFSDIVPAPAEPTCEVQDPLYLSAVEGEFSVTDPLLEVAGVEILEVQRTGIGHTETTGTPGNLEFKFTGGSGNGIIEFDSNVPFNAGEVIYVLYKIPV